MSPPLTHCQISDLLSEPEGAGRLRSSAPDLCTQEEEGEGGVRSRGGAASLRSSYC